MEKRPVVSFLLGSGFSVPEGLPSVHDVNRRLSKIDESEIIIHSSQVAEFLNGQNNPNPGVCRDERLFLQEFLEFYNSKVLKPGQMFHYEAFYDYAHSYSRTSENKAEIEGFYNEFNNKYFKGGNGFMDCLNRMVAFNRTFVQLLASLLHKSQYFNDVSYSNYIPYEPFIQFIVGLKKKNDVKVHSLNHDLFFDWLGRVHTDLWQDFTDGFRLEGSPYYGIVGFDFEHYMDKKRVHKSYYVKLAEFVNEFDTPLCFFKLHGSIFNRILLDTNGVRVKSNYAVSNFYKERLNEVTTKYEFEHLLERVEPDFLSGTTQKVRHYTGDNYYATLFKHFKDNLLASNLLIVVGYGFQDAGINEYLENEYLLHGKKMVVVDPHKPDTELIDKYSATHLPKGVTQVTLDEYRQCLT